MFKGTWQWGRFSGVFAEIGSSWVPYTTFRARSDFGFEFAEIFTFEKRLPAITDTGSRRLSVSVIQGVADSPYRWVGESTTPASLIRGVGNSLHHRYRESAIEFFKKKTLCIDDTESRRLPAPVILWVADCPYCWVGKSPTLRITDTESRRLCG